MVLPSPSVRSFSIVRRIAHRASQPYASSARSVSLPPVLTDLFLAAHIPSPHVNTFLTMHLRLIRSRSSRTRWPSSLSLLRSPFALFKANLFLQLPLGLLGLHISQVLSFAIKGVYWISFPHGLSHPMASFPKLTWSLWRRISFLLLTSFLFSFSFISNTFLPLSHIDPFLRSFIHSSLTERRGGTQKTTRPTPSIDHVISC